MRASVIVVICLLVISSQPTIGNADLNPSPDIIVSNEDYSDILRNITIKIVAVNFKQDVVNEAVLLDGLPVESGFTVDDGSVIYDVGYELTIADDGWVDNLRSVILANSVNGTDTGTTIDESALEYQETHPDAPQRVFYPRDGRVIDAYAIEDWLISNPAVAAPSLGYTLYLLNFSEFDSGDHSLEHWYDYHPVDPDTGEPQDWFRLEWDNALNPNVTLDYSGFGGRYNMYVLDASAHQWYLRWARIWWGNTPYNDHPDHCIMDLEDKVNTLDLDTTAGKNALNVYLRDYIYDPINFLFVPDHHSPAPYVETGLLKGLVFAMDVDEGTSVESLEWVTDAEMQKAHLEGFMPFYDWSADIDVLDIGDYPSWEDLFWRTAFVDTDGTTVADGYAMFYDIYDNMRSLYVDVDDENVNVFGVVFIKKQMEMHAAGRTFTGLGGGGQTVIWKTWERYYRPDGVTPKDGVSSVQLHETMHAVGVGHTWSYGHYVADFSFSPMGYLGFHNGTATFDQNWAQSSYLDQMFMDVWNTYLDRVALLGPSERQETLTAQQMALAGFGIADQFYEEMDWSACFNQLGSVEDWIRRMTYSRSDDEAPTISDWGIGGISEEGGTLSPWARVRDDLAGIENVTFHLVTDAGEELVYECQFNGGNWSTQASYSAYSEYLEVWFEAWDWGMNRAETNHTTYWKRSPPPGPFQDPMIVVVAATITLVLVLVVVLYVRKVRATSS
ncbi:MAG: hypothetical protein ACXAEN_21380 [Candidatus Thorarchaeota archaeon]|jgi:hypothetical protein